jgi:hypothetical protein
MRSNFYSVAVLFAKVDGVVRGTVGYKVLKAWKQVTCAQSSMMEEIIRGFWRHRQASGRREL